MRGYDYARMRGWSEGHRQDGFAGAKVRLFELWNYGVMEDAGMGGLDLLAVDVDGDPAGACLCHKLMFWQRWFKRPSQVGTVREAAVVGFDCVFIFPNTATTIAVIS